MLAIPKETHCPAASPSQRRLAIQLADMIPGAAAVRVSLVDPCHQWPHPHASAMDTAGQPVRLKRVVAKTAARWVLRTWPDADWRLPHTLDLGTGELALAVAGRGR
ncbi:transcriptional regulator [Kitasatospora acidiphila]|uniref:Transcriptional regulator n=1 Tax=Kitasatospora acidiphila TaxID=2567942 RepID=A0A540VZ41_9ACTN|nr:transcriptional regulator [Kitasatospora acidiphila]